jgi:hypothetical protein
VRHAARDDVCGAGPKDVGSNKFVDNQDENISSKLETTHPRRNVWESGGSLPTECSGDSDENRRSIKQKVLCGHVPPPCQHEDEELAQFVSPLYKLNNESTRLRKEDASTGHANLNTRVEQSDIKKETYSVEDGIWRLSYNEESEDVNEPNEAK